MNAHVEDVAGEVALTSAAIANSASFQIDSTDSANLNNFQMTNIDPRAYSNIGVEDVSGDVTSTTAAISNSLSVSSTLDNPALSLNINSTQLNNAYTGSVANTTIADVQGAVSVTSAAIGNSVSVSNILDEM